MQKVQKSQIYYDEIGQIVRKMMEKIRYKRVGQNLQVPNEFRTDDSKMKIWIQSISERGFKLNSIISWRNNGQFQLHILRGTAVMWINATEKLVLYPETSWIINEISMRKDIVLQDKNMQVLIEFRETVDHNERPMEDNTLLKSQAVVFTPTAEDFKQKRSFIRAPLKKEEIQELIRFVDCECAQANGKHRKSPLSVAIMNYKGDVLYDKLITPRNRILDYGTKYHGLTEEKTRNQEDEYLVIKKIQKAMEGKILVGHDLALEFASLLIPKKNILTKNNGKWHKLQTLAKLICDIDIQKGPHSAIEDVQAIRKIYMAVEDDWEDDIVPIRQEVGCTSISLEEYRRRKSKQTEHSEQPNSKRSRKQTPEEVDELLERWESNSDIQIIEDVETIMVKINMEKQDATTNTNQINMVVKDVASGTDIVYSDVQIQTEKNEEKTPVKLTEEEEIAELMKFIWDTENQEIQEYGVRMTDNSIKRRKKTNEVGTTTDGWDPELDELMQEEFISCGQKFRKTEITIRYQNEEGQAKIRTFYF